MGLTWRGVMVASTRGWDTIKVLLRTRAIRSKKLPLPMTAGSSCGKLIPESRKCPSQNSSLLTNAISAVAGTSWLCRYSMSRAQGRIPAQPIGDQASSTRQPPSARTSELPAWLPDEWKLLRLHAC